MEYSIDAYLIGAPGQSKNALEIVLGLISLMTPKERIFLVTGSHKVLEAAEKAGILNLYSSSTRYKESKDRGLVIQDIIGFLNSQR